MLRGVLGLRGQREHSPVQKTDRGMLADEKTGDRSRRKSGGEVEPEGGSQGEGKASVDADNRGRRGNSWNVCILPALWNGTQSVCNRRENDRRKVMPKLRDRNNLGGVSTEIRAGDEKAREYR